MDTLSNIRNSHILKSFLSFFWLLPFLYMFLDIYFDLDYKISPEVFKGLIFFSFFCALVLVAIWFKEFRDISYSRLLFKYILEENIAKLASLLSYTGHSNYLHNESTLLKYAIDEQASAQLVSLLLTRNCKVVYTENQIHNNSFTLFYLCSYYNYINASMINYLLEQGADINFVDNTAGFDGLSVFNTLILRNDKSLISLALEAGADAEYVIKELSMNSLMLAAKYVNDPVIIKLLIEIGCNIHQVNKDGYNAILFAAHYNPYPAVVATLVNAGASLKPYNIKSDILQHNTVTPLMLAASFNNATVVQKLIELGDDISFKDTFGISVLFSASANNTDIDVIKTLISAGASLEQARDNEGNTPLMAAAYLNQSPSLIKYLIDKTHNLKTTNRDGFDFIDYLRQNQHLTEEEKKIIINRWI